ncbi:hypothetical protein [Paenibacillus sp. HJGM_3]|uniref:hypothetical protein n=1 Tax=Paenibacillus sp. HJGM_3 TaxID=3379816 RepID=UPI00385FBD5B
MIGTFRWNLVLGAVGFGFTFLLSVGDNFFITTLWQSVYGFLIMFGVGFAIRFGLGTLAGLKEFQETAAQAASPEDGKGQSVDAVTPVDQDELDRLLREERSDTDPAKEEFQLLKPKRLTTLPAEPDELAQALRRLTEE